MQNKKTVIVISELFRHPYDEGMKVTAFCLFKAISRYVECFGIGPVADPGVNNITGISLNKLMLSYKLLKKFQESNPKLLIYIPEASATVNSFIRYKILKWMCNGVKTAIIALQNREYNVIKKNIINVLNPEGIFVLSSAMEKLFKSIDVLAHVLPIGVDMEKFTPVTNDKKRVLRNKYNIPQDCYLLLHIGHIRENRDIKSLLSLISQPGVKILIVGSTSTHQEARLKKELRQCGIFIIDYFVSENHELYQLADCYVFPVKGRTGAIEFPLSVLEAMACNLPVLTTPFGSLPEHFSPSTDFVYFNNPDELIQSFNNIKGVFPDNRIKVEKYSWDNVAKTLLQICGV